MNPTQNQPSQKTATTACSAPIKSIASEALRQQRDTIVRKSKGTVVFGKGDHEPTVVYVYDSLNDREKSTGKVDDTRPKIAQLASDIPKSYFIPYAKTHGGSPMSEDELDQFLIEQLQTLNAPLMMYDGPESKSAFMRIFEQEMTDVDLIKRPKWKRNCYVARFKSNENAKDWLLSLAICGFMDELPEKKTKQAVKSGSSRKERVLS